MENNQGNKAKRILNSGQEGGFRAGYIKTLSNNKWELLLKNLNKTNMKNAYKQVFRNAANMRSTHRVKTWTAKKLRSAGGMVVKAGVVVTAVVIAARKILPASVKESIINAAGTKFGPDGAKYARMLLISNSNTPPPPPKNEQEQKIQELIKQAAERNAKVRNAALEAVKNLPQSLSEMNANQQLALGNIMARARAGNANAQRRVNAIGNTARFQSSVAAAIVTPFAKGILKNIAGTMNKPFVNKVAKMSSKNQLVTNIKRKISVSDLAAIGERTAAVTQRNSRSQNMIRSALNLKRKLQSGDIMSLTNNQVSLLLQGIYKAPIAQKLFLSG